MGRALPRFHLITGWIRARSKAQILQPGGMALTEVIVGTRVDALGIRA